MHGLSQDQRRVAASGDGCALPLALIHFPAAATGDSEGVRAEEPPGTEKAACFPFDGLGLGMSSNLPRPRAWTCQHISSNLLLRDGPLSKLLSWMDPGPSFALLAFPCSSLFYMGILLIFARFSFVFLSLLLGPNGPTKPDEHH